MYMSTAFCLPLFCLSIYITLTCVTLVILVQQANPFHFFSWSNVLSFCSLTGFERNMKLLVVNIISMIILGLFAVGFSSISLDINDRQQDNHRALQGDSTGHVVCAVNPRKCPVLDSLPQPTARFGARCCASERFSLLSQKNVQYNCTVWAASKFVNNEGENVCATAVTLEEANDHCAAMNATLCTCEDMQKKCTKGTGCRLNKELSWCLAEP